MTSDQSDPAKLLWREGNKLYSQENYSEAIEKYSKALKIKPDYYDALFNMALSKYQMLDHQGALDIVKRLEELQQDKADVFVLHGRIAYEYSRRLTEEARNCVASALRIEPDQRHLDALMDDLNAYDLASEKEIKGIQTKLFEGSHASNGKKDGLSYHGGGDEYNLSSPRAEDSKLKLDDLVAMDSSKIRLEQELSLVLRSGSGKIMGNMFRTSGIVLYGPPGVGKTRLVKAFAGEHNIPIFSVRIHEVLDMWTGNSEKNLHSIFEAAMMKTPSIIFVDEIDALGRERFSIEGSGRSLINEFIVSMDELKERGNHILVIGTTNRPFDIDQALRRGGRFQTEVYVRPPEVEDRRKLFAHFLSDFEISEDAEAMEILARETEFYTPADIERVCRETLIHSLPNELDENATPGELSLNDILSIIVNYRAGGRTVRLWYRRLEERMGKDWFDFEYPELADDIRAGRTKN